MTIKAKTTVDAVVPAMTEIDGVFVRRAVESCLNQSFPCGVIVVTQDTLSWLPSFKESIDEEFPGRVRFVLRSLSNLSTSRNNGVSISSADWIAFLDADDTWRPEKIERQLAYAERTGADLVGCDHILIDSSDVAFAYGIPRNIPMPSSWFIKRVTIEHLRFNEQVHAHEDGEWWQNYKRSIKVSRLSEVHLNYRVRPGSMSSGTFSKRRKEIILNCTRIRVLRLATLGTSFLARQFQKKDFYVDRSDWNMVGG